MKKFFFMSITVLMAALAFTSCGSDDDKKDEPEQPKDKTVKYDVTVQFDQVLLDICDITVNYKDANGKNAQEKITSTTWTKSIKPTSLPSQMGVNFVYNVKTDKLTQDTYSFTGYIKEVAQAFGQTPRQHEEPFLVASNLAKDRVVEFLTKKNGFSWGMYIDKDGNITVKDPTF